MPFPATSEATYRRRVAAALLTLSVVGASAASAAATTTNPEPLGGRSESSAADQGPFTLVRVSTPTKASRATLFALGLDVERYGADSTTVLLHGAADQRAMRSAGLRYTTVVKDLAARNATARAAEERAASQLPRAQEARGAARGAMDASMPANPVSALLPPVAQAGARGQENLAASTLPSGRVSYRTMFEINNEMRYLAKTYPDRVTMFKLPHRSLLGASVWGLEITHDVQTRSGKPEMLMSGVHHSREWPTAEYTMELAWDLLLNDGKDARVTAVLDEARVVFVPVVNPDGFVISRSLTQEFKRKNCRVEPGKVPGPNECADPANFGEGVDLNRNYGSNWGGIGASGDRTQSNYRGSQPFSEPEIQNMRELSNSHQFTIAINNHTPDQRILRVPADSSEPDPVDEAPYQTLAESFAEPLGYQPGPWDEIYYNGSGVAEQHAFYSTGAYAFTPELDLGEGGFHPPYEGLVSEWTEHRETYLRMLEAATDPANHSVITGRAPAGAELTIENAFTMHTAPVLNADGTPGPIRTFPTALRSSIVVPDTGRFTWHVNSSVRPAEFVSALVADDWTVSCARKPGTKIRQEVDVTVGRGDVVRAAFTRCGR